MIAPCDNLNQSPFTPKAARLRRASCPVVAHRRAGVFKSATMREKICGVYQFTHIPSGKCYVGSSINVLGRFRSHIKESESGRGCFFHKEMLRLGLGNFRFHLIEICKPEERLFREKANIDRLECWKPFGFNLSKDPTKLFSYEFDDERKAGISKRLLGNQYLKGKKFSAESRLRMSESKIGHAPTGPKFHTAETLTKMSASHIGVKKNFSADVRKMLSRKMIGNKYGLGKHHSPEARRKISEARLKFNPMKGIKHSAEALIKMSLANKANWVKRKLKNNENNKQTKPTGFDRQGSLFQ